MANSLYEYRSVILATNKDFTDWGEFFHKDNVTVPSIDRIIHHSSIFMLGGDSYRLLHNAHRLPLKGALMRKTEKPKLDPS